MLKMNDNNSTIVYRSQIEKSIDESLYNNSNFMFVYGILRHYVALAQNQTNKKADLPSFYQLRPTPHKFTFITFEFYHNPIFL